MAPPSSEAASSPPKPVEDLASLAAAGAADLSGLACEGEAEAEGDAGDAGFVAAEPADPLPADVADEDEGAAEDGEAGLAGPEEDDVAEDAGDACELPEDALLAGEAEADDVPAAGFAPAAPEEAEPGVELLAEPAEAPVGEPFAPRLSGFEDAPAALDGAEGEPAVEDEELPAVAEDVEAVFAAPTSLACRSMVTGLRPAPAAAAPLASVAFGSPALGSADVEAVLLGSGFLLSAAMNGLSLGSFTGAGCRHGASIARPAASLPLTPLSMFAALAVQNKSAPGRVSPQAKKPFNARTSRRQQSHQPGLIRSFRKVHRPKAGQRFACFRRDREKTERRPVAPGGQHIGQRLCGPARVDGR